MLGAMTVLILKNMSDLLTKIINQNPWLSDAKKIHEDSKLINLKKQSFIWHEEEFLNHSFGDGVYIITGPRQIGKSTHVKMLIQNKITAKNKENFLYFNCDILDNKKEVVDLVEIYCKNLPNRNNRIYIILDEVTSVKDSILGVKYLVENGYKNNITYILTGSSTINIRKTGEYLPGRRGKGIDFTFLPLTFSEVIFTLFPNVKSELNKAKNKALAYHNIDQNIGIKKHFNL